MKNHSYVVRTYIIRKSFDFLLNYNGKSIFSICKKIGAKETKSIYDTYELLRIGGYINQYKELTKKGIELQTLFSKLNKSLEKIKE